MKLRFMDQKMHLGNFNARAELHGDEREPAGDIKLSANVPNDVLIEFHPALKSMLYHFDDARPADLADQGKREDGYAPHLRFSALGSPLKWSGEMTNCEVVIKQPGAKGGIELSACKVNNFQLDPKDGGTVTVEFRVQCHPDEKQAGKLCGLVQSEVEVTLTPLEE